MMRVRSSVVTTENPVARKLAACMAASAMPSTGADVDLARRQQAGIAETGDDIGIGIGILAHRFDQADNAHRLVIMAFDRNGAATSTSSP